MAGNQKDNRSTDAGMEARVTIVQDLLLSGKTRSAIIKECSIWKLSTRQIDTYIAMANMVISEINAVERETNLATVTMNYWDLFRIAKKMGDVKEARQVLDSISELKGLHEPAPASLNTNNPAQGLTMTELRDKLAKAKEKSH